jgi:hypothetical protein
MNLQENISTRLKRRTHLLDRVIDNLLPNMYPCDYNSSDHFVEGVLDEIRWFLVDVEELKGIERMDIENYILDYKYNELTEYFNERCVVLKNDNLQESIRRILSEDSRVYDYDPERNTVPFDERLPFDVDKLLSVGAVFITPAIDGDPKSKTYKKWLNEPYVHLITLKNVLDSNPDSWIHKAITKKGDPESYRKDFVYKFYDGKYNQILWSLEKLRIDPNDMIEDKDNSIQESIKRILREETELPLYIRRRVLYDDLEREFSESLDMSSNMLRNTNKEDGSIMSLNRFIDVTISILMDGIHYELYSTMPEDSQWYGKVIESLKDYYKDRIKSRYKKLVSNI